MARARRTGVPEWVRSRSRHQVRRPRVFLDGVMVPRDMVSFVGDTVRIEGFTEARAMIRDTVMMKRMTRMKRMGRSKRKLEEEEEARMILSEDERKKKLVYIFRFEKNYDDATIGDFKVVAFDPHEDEAVLESQSRSRFIDKTSITEAMPPNLSQLRNYQFAALGSMLYFIGGVHSNLGLGSNSASNRVFSFDTASQVWDEAPCMEVKRVLSTVVTYENKIYVFGYSRLFRATRKPEQWAEFFDPQTNAWNYLPGLPAPKELRERAGYMTVVGTALEDQKKILLCIQNVDVYSYSVVNQSWCHENYPSLTDFGGARWSNTVAVVKDTVFWYYFGNIFAFDFQPEVLDGELKCTVPIAIERFGIPVPHNQCDTYLVYAGNGKLCLVHDNQHGDGQYSFRCHTFQLRRSRTKKHFDLHYEGCASYQSKPPCGSVFAMAMI